MLMFTLFASIKNRNVPTIQCTPIYFFGLFFWFLILMSFISSSAFAESTSKSGTKKWSFQVGGMIKGAPAIGDDGTIYVGCSNGKLYAVNPDGTQKWIFESESTYQASIPVIADDGTIYASFEYLYALNKDGTKKWVFGKECKGGSEVLSNTPALGHNGTIYVSSAYGPNLYALNPNGSLEWSFTVDQGIMTSPALSKNGTIYVGSSSGILYTFNPNGSLNWSFKVDDNMHTPAIGDNGTIYIGSSNDNLYALNPDGTKKWSFKTDDDVLYSPVVGNDGTIYVGARDRLYAISPKGEKKWSYEPYGHINTPALGADGTIFIGTATALHALNPDGSLKWECSLDVTGNLRSPTVSDNGTILIGAEDYDSKDYLFAVSSQSGGPADSPWPMYHKDAKNAGRAEEDKSAEDSDNDNLPDSWEIKYFSSIHITDGHTDYDGDGLNELREYELGTDPTNEDTDGDGYNDGLESGDPLDKNTFPIIRALDGLSKDVNGDDRIGMAEAIYILKIMSAN